MSLRDDMIQEVSIQLFTKLVEVDALGDKPNQPRPLARKCVELAINLVKELERRGHLESKDKWI
jgi:hypothetical protein